MIDVWRWYHGERERESRLRGLQLDVEKRICGREQGHEDWQEGEGRDGGGWRMEGGEEDWMDGEDGGGGVVVVVDDGNAVFSVTISEEGGGLRIASDVKKGAASKKSETKSETKSAML